jgi:dihydroflavonol-4-reductase
VAVRALVTGSTGFIGSHLVRALVDRGDRVTCLVRPASDRSALEPLGVEFVEGDVTAAASLRAAVAGAEAVYHLAALLKQPWHPEFLTTNADGVRNVAAACAAAPCPPVLVVVSSLAAAGPSAVDRARSERDSPEPVSRYGRSKLGGELAALSFARRVPTTIVRPPIVIGEGDRGALPLFRAAALGLLPVASGDPPVSMIHAADLAAALVAAADSGERVPGATADGGIGIYFVADPARPRLSEVGREIAAELGRERVRVLAMPKAAGYAFAAAAEAYARLSGRLSLFHIDKAREAAAGAWVCSSHKACEQLGFAPQAPLSDRIRQTARWYRDRGWV